jgi:hypothetical protein
LVIKEYPATSMSVLEIKRLLADLKLKKGFKPEIIIVDYLNLMKSSIVGRDRSDYSYYGFISNELRAVAVEENVAIWSATQFNREGCKRGGEDASAGMTEISDSMGVVFNIDMLLGCFVTPSSYKINQMIIKQIKSRYMCIHDLPFFNMGIDIPRQKVFDIGCVDDYNTTVREEAEEIMKDEFSGIDINEIFGV